MTPLLALALIAIAPSTSPVTIHHTPTQEETMAQSSNQGQGSISYPTRHPNQPTPFQQGTGRRLGRDASNPGNMAQRHTIVRQVGNTFTENIARTTRQ